ncbi:methylaspartate ammonia-lyase [Mesorhizobium sp. ZC-5]|uniref:methylaspartate ammonia-lyase n=1 Tax=Mesorhizobium sp. ZC-5 TaxID=2986066 RepID=UPI0021E83E2A|nr:methylaspartate ammonia-lyase [Mesorhizobium sp. ZC-5]MCV3240751.1 methylaspartate ammonia-lyase [Mesorhizobium sp. ZC-5]
MKIQDVVYAVGRSAFMNKDLAAIKAGAKQNGSIYEGDPVLPGFKRIMQPGIIISVMLVLEDGSVAFGDCADVILTGYAGRDPLFREEDHIDFLRGKMRDFLVGKELTAFRPLAEAVDAMTRDGKRLHTAVRYGVTQAILNGVAVASRVTMAEVVAKEYGCPVSEQPIDILASIHNGDLGQLDRMVLKRIALLPHGSFQLVERDLGRSGEKLIDYARNLAERISEIRDEDYFPRIHLDLYGTLGELFGSDIEAMTDYMGKVAEAASPFKVLLESPVIGKTQDVHIEAFLEIRAQLRRKGIDVGVIADEWCNTLEDIKRFAKEGVSDFVQIKTPDLGGVNNSIEAVLYCRAHGMGCCLGGTANETDKSARITTSIALATQPNFMLSKPGLGGDEAVMIQTNEMARTLALIERRKVN